MIFTTSTTIWCPEVEVLVIYNRKTDGWECGLCSGFVPWGTFHPCKERKPVERNKKPQPL